MPRVERLLHKMDLSNKTKEEIVALETVLNSNIDLQIFRELELWLTIDSKSGKVLKYEIAYNVLSVEFLPYAHTYSV